MNIIFYLGCNFHGTVYVYGQHFIGTDGCSRCYCGLNGQVTCDDTPCGKYFHLSVRYGYWTSMFYPFCIMVYIHFVVLYKTMAELLVLTGS